MKSVNLLEFLKSINIINTLNFASCNEARLNLLDFLSEEEQFIQNIDLGIIYLKYTTLQNVILVDGLQRILSISLLLHAVCECYKKTSEKNDKAIEYIKSNYLIHDEKMKLRLPEKEQIIFEKIINGERLSGKEKKSSIFLMFHSMWSQIKENELQASNILKMLNKISIILVEADNTSSRRLYISLNRDSKELNQYMLIEDYLSKLELIDEWNTLKKSFKNKEDDLSLFFRDFFVTKFNFKDFNKQRLYEYFVNYFDTMMKYQSKKDVIQRILSIAKLYNSIINVDFVDEELKNAFIRIKMHSGEDTYAYLLNVYEDYIEQNITKATFIEILSTIDEYLQNRLKTPNDVSFNELISYLNAFVTCK